MYHARVRRPSTPVVPDIQSGGPFLGLAPFLRLNIAGIDLRPAAREILAQAQAAGDDADLWMNLAIVTLCLGQRDLGLAMQAQALALRRVYHLPAARRPARARLLLLAVPGDLAANTPLECLLEDSDIDLDYCYLSGDDPCAEPLPEHDALMVAISESDANRALLAALEPLLARWHRPVLNAPQCIPTVGRETASAMLGDAPGVLMPPTWRASRLGLAAVAAGTAELAGHWPGAAFPVLLRPVGSHAGRDLERLAGRADLAAYLARVDAAEFYLSPFIDYRSADGLYRKYRVALIGGQAYACHMAVSAHWMIHYVNAGMYEDAQKREEEAGFMDGFAAFARAHAAALKAIHARTGLDYVCIDCAQTPDGQLLVFEVDHAMVVHAMDPPELFPYKQAQMRKVSQALRDLVLARVAAR